MLEAPEPRISLVEARRLVAGARIWAITDGKMGDLAQCLGVAERLGLAAESRIVRPRGPFAWLMPWGPIDPAEASSRAGSPIAAPFPDIAIASGRRAVPYLRHVKAASGGRTLTMFLKDPRCGTGAADLIWVPAHDRLRGANVLTTLTSPHRLSPERLALAANASPPWPADHRPVAGMLIGGDSKDFRFTEADIARFADDVGNLARSGMRIIATPSRRTPPQLAAAIRAVLGGSGGWLWDGQGENPYLAILAQSRLLVVTAESVNMVGEAAATGKPVLLFRPTGASRKIDQFLRGLEAAGAARPFQGRPEDFTYEPMDSTPLIARALAERFAKRS